MRRAEKNLLLYYSILHTTRGIIRLYIIQVHLSVVYHIIANYAIIIFLHVNTRNSLQLYASIVKHRSEDRRNTLSSAENGYRGITTDRPALSLGPQAYGLL